MLQQLLTFHNPTFNIIANSVASARPDRDGRLTLLAMKSGLLPGLLEWF